MKPQILFIHGGSACSSYDDFLTYLKTVPIERVIQTQTKRWTDDLRDLSKGGYEVFMPKMPNAENAKYEEWKIWFERHFELMRDGAILVGWSQGGCFLTKYLAENDVPFTIGGLCLVAAPFESVDFGGEDGGDFFCEEEKIHTIQDKVKNIHIFHSKDDFVVPYEHALLYKKHLDLAILHSFEDRNHFLQEKFPELLEEIQKMG